MDNTKDAILMHIGAWMEDPQELQNSTEFSFLSEKTRSTTSQEEFTAPSAHDHSLDWLQSWLQQALKNDPWSSQQLNIKAPVKSLKRIECTRMRNHTKM